MSREYREFYDRDAIEVKDGSIYIVIGSSHPIDRVISYLKYIPSFQQENSIWLKNGVWYRRLLSQYGADHVYQTVKDYIRYIHPEYIVFDQTLNIKMVEVPVSDIKQHYMPEERIYEIIDDPKDELEEMVRKLVIIISSKSSVDIKKFGVSGSILVKMHNIRYSDIDLIVYGYKAGHKIRKILPRLLDGEDDINRLKGPILKKYARDLSEAYHLAYDEAVKYYNETWSRGLFKNRFFSIHPVLTENEVPVKYGKQIYRSMGFAKAVIEVIDDKYSIFNPAIYIGRILNLESSYKLSDIKYIEVVSYEGIYAGIMERGEVAEVYGKLEEVKDLKKDNIFYRLLIGSFEAFGKDYIKRIR